MYIDFSNKMLYINTADPDQTAPEVAIWSGATLFTIPQKYTNFSKKMFYTNSADPDQTNRAVWSGSTLFVIPQSILREKKGTKKIGGKR